MLDGPDHCYQLLLVRSSSVLRFASASASAFARSAAFSLAAASRAAALSVSSFASAASRARSAVCSRSRSAALSPQLCVLGFTSAWRRALVCLLPFNFRCFLSPTVHVFAAVNAASHCASVMSPCWQTCSCPHLGLGSSSRWCCCWDWPGFNALLKSSMYFIRPSRFNHPRASSSRFFAIEVVAGFKGFRLQFFCGWVMPKRDFPQ